MIRIYLLYQSINDMPPLIEEWEKKAQQNRKKNRDFLKKLKSKNRKVIDQTAAKLHDEVFQSIDCLDCANCCKGLGPMVSRTDIKRMSKHLRMKERDFEEEYIRLDEDGDWVMKAMPCPFLLDDNYCSIYEARPKACREYPHTDMNGFASKPNIHAKNTLTCPAAFHVVERMRDLLEK
jgi:Fe-S-cluster containining protein